VACVPDCDPAWHLFVVLIDYAQLGTTRQRVMAALQRRGIGSQVHYIPLHLQPYYRGRHDGNALPGALAYYARALSLPLYPSMSDADVDRVIESLAEAVRT
jgi:dTDP-4-amino-4,6-dideoxygalactose transaminase